MLKEKTPGKREEFHLTRRHGASLKGESFPVRREPLPAGGGGGKAEISQKEKKEKFGVAALSLHRRKRDRLGKKEKNDGFPKKTAKKVRPTRDPDG